MPDYTGVWGKFHSNVAAKGKKWRENNALVSLTNTYNSSGVIQFKEKSLVHNAN